jgi:outer membrane protein assembly factor BamB
VKNITPLSSTEVANNANKEAEKQKKIAEASAQMDNSRDYSSVEKDKLKSGNYYWALVNDGNGNYTLKKIEYYSEGEYDEYYFELDNNGKNIKKDTNGKNIKINSNNIEKLWEKKLLSSFFGKPSASTYVTSAGTGGKSRRHRKNSLRKRKLKKTKKRRHTKRR